MCVSVTKVGQGHPMLLLVQDLCRAYQVAKAQIWSLSVTSRYCSGIRNVATFRDVPEIRNDFTPLYLENGKS